MDTLRAVAAEAVVRIAGPVFRLVHWQPPKK